MAEGEKNEKPTAKKRRDARKKGDVLTSKDVTTVVSIVATFSALWFHGPSMAKNMQEFFQYILTVMVSGTLDVIKSNGELIAMSFIRTFIGVAAIPLGVSILSAVLATMYQTKGLVTREPLKPDFGKLSPLKGIKKMFALKNLVDALKNLIKITVLLYIIYLYFMDTVLTFSRYFSLHPAIAATELMGHIFTLVMRIVIAFIAIAVFDYGYAWYEYEKKLKMTKQEVKDEYKMTEGDPKIKAKIKQKQFQMAQNRMMSSVPEADVIIRNPTHYAVALRYNKEVETPIILAMGADHLAFKIISVGEEHQVPIVENVQVARALYATGEVGKPIPHEMYTAVANIILYVMSMNNKKLEDYIDT